MAAAQRVNRTGELDQSPIARQLDQPPAMAGQDWLKSSDAIVP